MMGIKKQYMFKTLFLMSIGVIMILSGTVMAAQTDWKGILANPSGWFGSPDAISLANDIVKYQQRNQSE